MKKQRIVNGIFYTPIRVVNLIKQTLNGLNGQYDVIVDNAAGALVMHQINPNKDFIGIDLTISQSSGQQNNQRLFAANSLVKTNGRKKLNLEDKTILIATNPPYCDQTSFYQKQLKQAHQVANNSFKSNDLGISFFKTYDNNGKADYAIILSPLAYFLKPTKLRQLFNGFNHYQLVKQQVISSEHFEHLRNKSHFPIVITYGRRDCNFDRQWGVHLKDLEDGINQVQGAIYNLDLDLIYHVQFSQFANDRIQNYGTKYPNKKLAINNYRHFGTLRDINWLAINQTGVATERPQTIRVAPEVEQHFEQLDRFKKGGISGGKKDYWWLANYDPLVIGQDNIDQGINERVINNANEN